jgi:hypothetical protein
LQETELYSSGQKDSPKGKELFSVVLLDAWSERAALLKAILTLERLRRCRAGRPGEDEHNTAERKFSSMSPTVWRRESRRAKAGGEAN